MFAVLVAGRLAPGAAVLAAIACAAVFPLRWASTLPPLPGAPHPDAALWSAGAAGEKRTAWRLRALESRGWAVLHDRLVPGSHAKIDHLVIGPKRRPGR